MRRLYWHERAYVALRNYLCRTFGWHWPIEYYEPGEVAILMGRCLSCDCEGVFDNRGGFHVLLYPDGRPQ